MTTITSPELRQTSLLDLLPEPGTVVPAVRRLGAAAVSGPLELPTSRDTGLGQPIRFVDHFAGIGGFHLALDSLGAQCVFATERDRFARTTYLNNFGPRCPDMFAAGHFAHDIADVDPADVPVHDIVTAGFPCQPFSFAGRQRGLDDERGVMFYQLARLIMHTRPRAFIFENVAGLRFHNHGTTFAAIRETMTTQLGYSFRTAVLRACDYGLPQLRPRLFMVGFRDPSIPFTFPEPTPLGFTLSDLFGGHCDRELAYTLLASGFNKHVGQKFNFDAYLVDSREHRLTAREAATLQGFPDDFLLPAIRARALAQIGNAVAVPVATAVARQVITALHTHDTCQEAHS
ncbi:DNA cytosine methyltransferase [Gordonia sp. N1V]|uniref:DNA cytosine methyltransferase n=1 Tax=Gordonia sp. N1V TaxID=3034163 RepID=UPI0023E310AF|nr:DNA cytosine methyltransferase [Gordonia sp. N1V]MDF3284959.1 DNA cytosine methyltransferase [Gordonia sp. N1V]